MSINKDVIVEKRKLPQRKNIQKKTKDKIHIWTDGSCLYPNGPCGWAAIIKWNHTERIRTGRCISGTNNVAELNAILTGLEEIARPWDIAVYSDSKYCCNGGNTWIHNWQKRNWTRKNGELKNVDLWKRLYTQIQKHDKITFIWVKGHNGDRNNELADKLAGEESRLAQQEREENEIKTN